MAEELKITFLQAVQKEQAVNLLSKAFNMTAREALSSLDAKYANDNVEPITFAASIEGQVMGVVKCVYYRPDYASVYLLAVESSHREQGIGHALMAHAETFIGQEWMKGKPGVIGLVDETKKENPSSTFYEKMGYEPEKGSLIDGCPGLNKHVNGKLIPRQKQEHRR